MNQYCGDCSSFVLPLFSRRCLVSKDERHRVTYCHPPCKPFDCVTGPHSEVKISGFRFLHLGMLSFPCGRLRELVDAVKSRSEWLFGFFLRLWQGRRSHGIKEMPDPLCRSHEQLGFGNRKSECRVVLLQHLMYKSLCSVFVQVPSM